MYMLPAMIIQRRQIAFFLWFCFLVFLVVMAAEGKASIYFTAVIYLFFYFIGIDERPAMGSQPNLFSRPEVVSIYKCPPPILGVLSKFGAQKTSNFVPLFSRLPHATPHISGTKRRID